VLRSYVLLRSTTWQPITFRFRPWKIAGIGVIIFERFHERSDLGSYSGAANAVTVLFNVFRED
jgi:hypothetical protein